jgi:outer membrane protein assembly factor BamB
MRRRLLIGGVLLVVVLGACAAAYYRSESDPVEKRGSAKEEFDRSAEPAKRRPPGRKRTAEAWPTFGYDLQRSQVSPYDHRPPFRRTWRIDAHDTLEFPPSAAYGNVYIAQQKGLFFALDGKTGRKVFPRKNFKRCAASSPTIAKGTVYQSYMDFAPCPQNASRPTGFVTAINAKTGKERWRFKAQPIESSPLLRKGVLYVGSWDHNVYAISARTGRKIWSFQTDDRVNTSPAYSKGRIFIATNGGSLYALSARTGKLAWRARSQSRFGSREFFYAAPTVAYGRIFIGNTDGTMYAFGQRSGKLLWANPLGTYIYSAAAVYKQRVFVGTYDGRFFALDAATGDTRWRRGMPSAVHAAPVVMGGIVYASTCSSCGSAASRAVKGGKDSTTGFDTRNGRTRWRNNGGKYASPIIADRDRVYFTGRSYLYGLEPKRRRGSRDSGAERAQEGRSGGRTAATKRKRRAAARRRAAQRRAVQRRAARRRAARRRAPTSRRKRQSRPERRSPVRPRPTTLPRWW